MRPRPALLAVALACSPALAWAHEGEHHLDAPTVLHWWTWSPLVLATLTISAALYLRGLRALWRHAGRGHGLARWEVGCYAGGLATIALALLSPIDKLGAILFSAHMTQHELLILLAAPLFVLGRPLLAYLWALGPAGRERVGGWTRKPPIASSWRALTHPVVVLLLHAVALWAWHIPALFEGAMRSEPVHAVQHFMFFITAALFWWALVHGRYGKAGYGVSVLFVFGTAMHSSVLGALITFARGIWYPIYVERGAAWNVSPLEDQQLAGLLMWVPAGVIFIFLGLALFAAWLGESERRVRQNELLARARAQEVES